MSEEKRAASKTKTQTSNSWVIQHYQIKTFFKKKDKYWLRMSYKSSYQ